MVWLEWGNGICVSGFTGTPIIEMPARNVTAEGSHETDDPSLFAVIRWGFCSRLFYEIAVFVFIINAVEFAKPFLANLVRLYWLQQVPERRAGLIQPGKPFLNTVRKRLRVGQNRKIERVLYVCANAVFFANVVRDVVERWSEVLAQVLDIDFEFWLDLFRMKRPFIFATNGLQLGPGFFSKALTLAWRINRMNPFYHAGRTFHRDLLVDG
jgi:hypothetical protein